MTDFFNPNNTVFKSNDYNPFDGSGTLSHAYLTDNPQASFGAFVTENQGVPTATGAGSPFANYLQRNYSRLLSQYQGDVLNSPQESFYDYLGKNRQSLLGEYNNLSPSARGERPDSLVGRLRYVGF